MASAIFRLCVALILLVVSSEALALRCDGRIVATGDRDFQVRGRCGAPYFVDGYSELVSYGSDHDQGGYGGTTYHRSERVYEDWYYNFGGNRLLYRLRFRDGRLVRIDTHGYGRNPGESKRCDDATLARGTPIGQVYLHCGPPYSRQARYRDASTGTGGYRRQRQVRYEEWLYPSHRAGHSRLAIFIEGRLHRIEHVRY